MQSLSLEQYISVLNYVDRQLISLLERITLEARGRGISLTYNFTPCGKDGCGTYKFVKHGPYLTIYANGKRRRVRQAVMMEFVRNLTDADTVESLSKLVSYRHHLIAKVNAYLRWRKFERQVTLMNLRFAEQMPPMSGSEGIPPPQQQRKPELGLLKITLAELAKRAGNFLLRKLERVDLSSSVNLIKMKEVNEQTSDKK